MSNLNNNIGNINLYFNTTYNSLEKLLAYYIDNNYLPDLNLVPIVPVMTSNTCSVGTVSASSVFTSGYEPYKLFDDDYTSSWISGGGGTQWIKFSFIEPKCVKKYEFAYETYNRFFTTCRLYGSNDNSVWDLLDVQNNLVKAPYKKYSFIISNNKKYLYYRWEIVQAESYEPAASYLQFYENP